MNLQKTKDWADIVLKVISVIAIIVGGIWAYFQFAVTAATDSNIELAIKTEVIHYSENDRLLLIHVRPKNIGKVPVSPDHFTVSMRDLPLNLKPGKIDLDNLNESYSTSILDKYKDGYDLEPGVTYDEVWAVIVPKDTMYAIRAEIDFDNNENEIDQTAVVKVEDMKCKDGGQ